MSSGTYGPSLVIGRCGFMGFHIVEALLKEPAWGPVSVFGRTPNYNRCEGASYHKGDICNADDIRRILTDLKPRIIFHTAAPELPTRPLYRVITSARALRAQERF